MFRQILNELAFVRFSFLYNVKFFIQSFRFFVSKRNLSTRIATGPDDLILFLMNSFFWIFQKVLSLQSAGYYTRKCKKSEYLFIQYIASFRHCFCYPRLIVLP